MANIITVEETAPAAGERSGGFLRTVREMMQTKAAKAILFLLQFIGSLFTLIYFQGVLRFAYYSLFYRLEIPAEDVKSYAVSVIFSSLGWAALMLFTRRQIVTRLVIMFSTPLYFPIFLFHYKHLCLVIPLAVFIVVTYLACGSGEGVKTILGAVFLMFYVIGTFVFLAVQSILKPAVTEYTVERGVSALQNYRYSIVQVDDRANGHTYVAIEPNTYDIGYNHSTWYAKGYGKTIYLARPRQNFNVRWETQARADITRDLLLINPRTEFTLNADQMKILGLDQGFSVQYKVGELTPKARRKLGIALKTDLFGQAPEALGLTLRQADEVLTLTFQQMVDAGLSPEMNQRLANLSDENLAALGIPEQCDVLYVNGKVVFRQYIAVLERTYAKGSRDLSAFLDSNELPAIVDPATIPQKELPPSSKDADSKPESTTETTETTEETTETTTSATTAATKKRRSNR